MRATFTPNATPTKSLPSAAAAWINPREFTVRFGAVLLLDHFLTPAYAAEAIDQLAAVSHEGYYVKMAVGWALSVGFVPVSPIGSIPFWSRGAWTRPPTTRPSRKSSNPTGSTRRTSSGLPSSCAEKGSFPSVQRLSIPAAPYNESGRGGGLIGRAVPAGSGKRKRSPAPSTVSTLRKGRPRNAAAGDLT